MEVCERSRDSKQCLVCYRSTDQASMVECGNCLLTVHLKCYGCATTNTEHWKCRYCIYNEEHNIDGSSTHYSIKCRICNQQKFGALKPCVNNDGFAHLVCALLTPWIFVWNQYHYSPIHNIQICHKLNRVLQKLECMICRHSHATVKCKIKSCQCYFHPLCLLEHYNHCVVKQDVVIGKLDSTMYHTYCPGHVHLHQHYNASRITKIGRQAIIHGPCKDSDDDVILSTHDHNSNQHNVRRKEQSNTCVSHSNHHRNQQDRQMRIDEPLGVLNMETLNIGMASSSNHNTNSNNMMFDELGSVFHSPSQPYLSHNAFGTELSPFPNANFFSSVSSPRPAGLSLERFMASSLSINDTVDSQSPAIPPQRNMLSPNQSQRTLMSAVSATSTRISCAPTPPQCESAQREPSANHSNRRVYTNESYVHLYLSLSVITFGINECVKRLL